MNEGPRAYRKIESRESPELFRASLGFDFIFVEDADGVKQPYCIEINGSDTGVKGVQDIPKGDIPEMTRLFASIRSREDSEFVRKNHLGGDILTDLGTGDFPVSSDEVKKSIGEFVKASLAKHQMFSHAIENPHEIDIVTKDKRVQRDYIPEQYRPRAYRKGESTVSSTGYWICKPAFGVGGNGIFIVTSEELARVTADPTQAEAVAQYAIQECLDAVGADRAAPGMEQNPASLRLLMDFVYREDGTIETLYETAYQRVSQFGTDHPRMLHSKEEVRIVNKNRGALSAAASPRESELAHKAATEIIHALATDLQSSRDVRMAS